MHGTEGKFQIEHSDKALNGAASSEKIPRDFNSVGRSETAREASEFESLAKLLRPKPADNRIGRCDLDARKPGSNLPGVDNADLGGVLRLGGALRAPEISLNEREIEQERKNENWDEPNPHKFQTALASFINLSDDYSEKTPAEANRNSGIGPKVENDPDPIVTPPLYGGWHALTRRLLVDINGYSVSPDNNWTHKLNLDPRYRIPAGYGTQVVRKNQEEYMNAAWEQAAVMIEANRRIRAAQLAREVSWIWYERRLKPLRSASVDKAFAITAPAQKRVTSRNSTVFDQLDSSAASPALVSPAMRRLIRPRGRLMRLLSSEGGAPPDNLISRVISGKLSSAEPRLAPTGLITVNQVSDTLGPKKAPQSIRETLPRYPWLKYSPIALACIISPLMLFLGVPGLVAGVILAAGLVYAYKWLDRLAYESKRSGSILEENQTPESIYKLPQSEDFVLTEPDSGFTPTHGQSDSAQATLFKTGLRDVYTLIGASAMAAEAPPKNQIEIAALTDDTIEALNPEMAIPQRALQIMTIPDRMKAALTEEFNEAMVYPEIDLPMYEPLKELAPERFLPNINLIEKDSITLLETNQKFIEAYMVGVNHEFARELLWRGYPTDQRGVVFRQFWDASVNPDSDDSAGADGVPRETAEEKLRDITPLHTWPKFSDLGDHNLRQEGAPKEEEVVLVIRGELLNKFPDTFIYAHRARWRRNSEPVAATNGSTNGSVTSNYMTDGDQRRRLEDLNGTDQQNPANGKIKTPVYFAKIEPDIFFFGFDLTIEQARGGAGENSYDDPGWFFVLKEQSDEENFDLDGKISDLDLKEWSDRSWERAAPGAKSGAYLQINNQASFKSPSPAAPDDQKKNDHREDGIYKKWNNDSTPADPPHVLHQAPSLMAIHAAEMLLKK